ncbi:MAG: hypothetical protein U0234_19315 [Sandaracinus sp.]
MVRAVLPALVLALAALGSGCPRTDPPPDRMGGMPCTTTADCNPDRTCGEMALCVTGLCEIERSLIVACPGMGERPAP